jgi:hypothetical protein
MINRLKEILSYDPETGVFRWKTTQGPRAIAGSKAGWKDGKGYICIKIDGVSYRSHRLAWLYMNGEWPEKDIDHKNLDPGDNRWCNLREATRSENGYNQNKHKTNTSGYKGVYYHKVKRKWVAIITVNGKRIHLNQWNTKEEAHAAYCEAAEKYHKDFARIE